MTTDQWVALNMFTGEIGPAIEPPHRPRRADAAFTALVKLCGYEGAVLTDSLRGALNKAHGQIKRAERERDEEVSLDDIAELINKFATWFKTYRRERFNENCQRAPYPMETAKLWPEYRKAETNIAADWQRYINARDASPSSIAYKKAHPEVMQDENDKDENEQDTN